MEISGLNVDSLMQITPRPPVVFVRGEGSWLFDAEDRKYLDFIQGWAVNSLGHCSEVVRRALAMQSRKLINPGPAFWNIPSAQLASHLVENSCFERVFFASSGAEANEGAIKLARKWGAKFRQDAYKIVTFEGAFHGRTLCTMAASGKPGWAPLFEPKVPGFPKAILNNISSVESLIDSDTVAVMIEPVQGEAGVRPATPRFMQAMRELTRSRGILMIVDEVQTGMGRTGRAFSYQNSGVEPDIMTLGKGIGGGVPLAALLAREEVACFEIGDQGGTYCGNPLMTAVGLEVARTVLEPGFLQAVCGKGEHLIVGLSRLATKHRLGDVRGQGLLVALDFPNAVCAAVADNARDSGLLINACRPNTLRFMPALTVSHAEIDEMLSILDSVLNRCSGAQEKPE